MLLKFASSLIYVTPISVLDANDGAAFADYCFQSNASLLLFFYESGKIFIYYFGYYTLLIYIHLLGSNYYFTFSATLTLSELLIVTC